MHYNQKIPFYLLVVVMACVVASPPDQPRDLSFNKLVVYQMAAGGGI